MVFCSFTFISIFLPAVLVLYLLLPNIHIQNGLLILASLIFYAYGEPVYVLILLASIAVNYGMARLISRFKDRKKILLVLDLIINLGLLGVFKYTGFILQTINQVTGLSITDPQITMPIGISFFTFQALSYVIDVYRGEVEAEKNPGYVLLYISFFPQLIAGPIVKYRDIRTEVKNRKKDPAEIANGLARFILGLAKKVLISNAMSSGAELLFAAEGSRLNALNAWLGAILFMLHIYYDFSGYSDMAIGMGQMFGFHFRENFLHPYGAVNIQDFWRKWHISLSSWFKDYVYIPLGGNRKGKKRTVINKIIVFFLTGLWHGASWNFVLWGLYHGFFLLLEEYIPLLKKLPKALGLFYTNLVVCVGFVLFNCTDLGAAGRMFTAMFTGFSGSAPAESLLYQVLTPWRSFMLLIAILFAALIPWLLEKIPASFKEKTAVKGICFLCLLALFCLCLLQLSAGGYNPFIYFRF